MMFPSEKRIPATLKLVLALLALLGLLAVLQYRWLGQVSRAAQERMHSTLVSAVNRFAEDFDREIARGFVYFRLAPLEAGVEGQLAERWRLWNEEAPYPDLVTDVFFARPEGEGGFQWMRFDSASGLKPMDDGSASRLQAEIRNSVAATARGRDARMPFFVIEGIPAVAIPVPFAPNGPRPGRLRPGGRNGRPGPPERPALALVLLELDLTFIREEWLPALTARHFHRGSDSSFEMVVHRRADPDAVVFQSDPQSLFRDGDATTTILGPAPFEELRQLWVETSLGLDRARPRGPGFEPPPEGTPAAADAGMRRENGHWQVVVRHRAGSLEAAVSALRFRNLAIGLGVLALLGLSMVMILASTQRAQQLAKQQMEFVAGVTHELQTPLAVIRSAGQNLADGVVDGERPVKEYGALIEKEGRRLSDMVNQVLELAGLQSRASPRENVAVSVEDILETALADCESVLTEQGVQIESNIDSDLPPIQGDASALRRAFRNLIENAAKYGGDGKWIGIGARRERDTLVITVADRGSGIAPVDLPHVFEPFYRGRHTAGGIREVRGTGLGLSLVRQIIENHGGRATVRSTPTQGTVFTIHLPTGSTTE